MMRPEGAPTFGAIPTTYKGITFRSRLEARWSIYLDGIGVAWDYEPEGYTDDAGTRYLPDFWLPEFRSFLEIKPSRDFDRTKAHMLALLSRMPVFLGFRLPRSDAEWEHLDESVMACIEWTETDASAGHLEYEHCGFFVCDCGRMAISRGPGERVHQGECSQQWLNSGFWLPIHDRSVEALFRAASWQFR